MSGECAICNEHPMDCQCVDLGNGLIKTKWAVKMKPSFFIFKESLMNEEVNHPNHYQGKTFEAIDIIEDYDLNFNLGNAIKYILRCDKKGCNKKDLEKAIWY